MLKYFEVVVASGSFPWRKLRLKRNCVIIVYEK